MKIVNLIEDALKPLGMDTFYITRGENKGECIVYTYISNSQGFADNREYASKYTVLLNVYSFDKIEDTKAKVISHMKKRGFIKSNMQATRLEDNGYYNTPIQFKISLLED